MFPSGIVRSRTPFRSCPTGTSETGCFIQYPTGWGSLTKGRSHLLQPPFPQHRSSLQKLCSRSWSLSSSRVTLQVMQGPSGAPSIGNTWIHLSGPGGDHEDDRGHLCHEDRLRELGRLSPEKSALWADLILPSSS